jgi:hypothetical protein
MAQRWNQVPDSQLMKAFERKKEVGFYFVFQFKKRP